METSAFRKHQGQSCGLYHAWFNFQSMLSDSEYNTGILNLELIQIDEKKDHLVEQ
jgi:hypothetical protein